VETILKEIEEVDEEKVRALAGELFNGNFCLTVLGPVDGNGIDKQLLKTG
jgi:hypothetical protein